MRKILVVATIALALACLMPAPAAQAARAMGVEMGTHRVGVGLNYWKTIDNLDQDVSNDGFSYLATYQYAPLWYLKVEGDLEWFPDLDAHSVWAPEVFVTVGGTIYAGLGMGMYYHDGNWGDSPFYMLRAGFDFPVAPRLFLDVNVNYRFNDWNTLEWSDLDTDTIRLGAALRFAL